MSKTVTIIGTASVSQLCDLIATLRDEKAELLAALKQMEMKLSFAARIGAATRSDLAKLAEQARAAIARAEGREAMNIAETLRPYQETVNEQAERIRDLDAQITKLRAALKACLPYVERAYECAFPDATENDAIIEQARATLRETEGR